MSVRILTGCALAMLPTLDAESVQTCVTSPPYFGLRDYGVAGQIGLERTPDEYVARLVEVFREVRRVLRDDGCIWVNLGDSYATGTATPRGATTTEGPHVPASWSNRCQGERVGTPIGYKTKDLLGMPWLVAFALRTDGWYLRSDIIWAKPNPMPESVRDRPTKSHEYLFLLSKRPTYYYDAEAIAEPAAYAGTYQSFATTAKLARLVDGPREHNGNESPDALPVLMKPNRNRRTVWTVATQPYSGAHFATFPPALIEPCILAGSSPRACERCGAPWARVVERTLATVKSPASQYGNGAGRNDGNRSQLVGATAQTTGWQPTCGHENAGTGRCVVLDPFLGAGTTAVVADRLGRDCVGVELNPEYVALAEARIRGDAGLFAEVSA